MTKNQIFWSILTFFEMNKLNNESNLEDARVYPSTTYLYVYINYITPNPRNRILLH